MAIESKAAQSIYLHVSWYVACNRNSIVVEFFSRLIDSSAARRWNLANGTLSAYTYPSAQALVGVIDLASRLCPPSSIPSFCDSAILSRLKGQAFQPSSPAFTPEAHAARMAVEAPDAPRDAMWEVERAQPQGQRPIPATQTSPELAHAIPRILL